MANKNKAKRNKNGKIKAWECHLRCEFTKPDDTNKYIERCSVKVDKPNLAAIKGTKEVYAAVDGWINELIDAKGYNREVKLTVERWMVVR
jgi:ribosome-associated translation inhibitor RaiA